MLTSLDETDIRELGFPCSVEELVLRRAQWALEAGCAGAVSYTHLDVYKRQDRGFQPDQTAGKT